MSLGSKCTNHPGDLPARAVLPFLAMMTIQEVVFVLLFAVVLMAAAELMVWGLDVVFWAPSKADECLSRERAS
jgi:hypothetical protein